MKVVRPWLANGVLAVASVAITLAALEIVLRVLPVAWGAPIVEPTPTNPLRRYASHAEFVYSVGWRLANVVRGRTNAQGWLADYDYDPSAATPLVAVIGDSFMEASRVPFADTVTGRLQAALASHGRAYVFALGGSPLSQYVAYARHACATYRPKRLVVSIVGNDFDESLYASRWQNGLFHLHPRPQGGFDLTLTPIMPPGLLERIGRHSALAIYLLRNVGLNRSIARMGVRPAQTPDYVGNTRAAASERRVNDGLAVVDWFLRELPNAACLPESSIVLSVDAARAAIYRPEFAKRAQESYFGQMRTALISLARARGFIVVDLDEHFRRSYAIDAKRFEVPDDGHWNARAHQIAFAAVCGALRGWEPLTSADCR